MASNLKWTAGEHTAEVLNEAADEIERLRQTVKGQEMAAMAIMQIVGTM
jgi:hypothetical protein